MRRKKKRLSSKTESWKFTKVVIEYFKSRKKMKYYPEKKPSQPQLQLCGSPKQGGRSLLQKVSQESSLERQWQSCSQGKPWTSTASKPVVGSGETEISAMCRNLIFSLSMAWKTGSCAIYSKDLLFKTAALVTLTHGKKIKRPQKPEFNLPQGNGQPLKAAVKRWGTDDAKARVPSSAVGCQEQIS